MTGTTSTPITVQPQVRIQSANLSALRLLLTSVLLGAVGQLMLKLAVTQTGILEFSAASLLALAFNPVLLIALTIYAISAGLWLLALMRADLSFAYPFLSLTLVAVLFGGAFLFNERVTPARVIGFVIIMCGLFIIARDEKSDKKSLQA